jgi:hypothetical protein
LSSICETFFYRPLTPKLNAIPGSITDIPKKYPLGDRAWYSIGFGVEKSTEEVDHTFGPVIGAWNLYPRTKL